MRVLVHDYGGYSFAVQLSRELAKGGHEVIHLYGDSTQLVKRGYFGKRADDPDNYEIMGIGLSRPFQKYSLVRRRAQEIEYGRLVAAKIDALKPGAVISANTPLDAQAIIWESCKDNGGKFVYWLQDLIGLATYRILRKKSKLLANTVGKYYQRFERKLIQRSDSIVVISDDFQWLMAEWGISEEKRFVVQNWAPLEEIPPGSKLNAWAQKNGLTDKFCFLYTGVLGFKHDPELLLQLASYWDCQAEVRVVVISEGPRANWLRNQGREQGLGNLMVLDYQPYECFPEVLASADVLLAILDAGAGVYSVPSKVYTYMCAKRPLLLAVPSENLSAKIVTQNNAGIVVPPGNPEEFVEAAKILLEGPGLRKTYAANARRFAEENFDIRKIGKIFNQVISN
jgi:colanic acid biosynthesis glycosyl transferase WcaI